MMCIERLGDRERATEIQRVHHSIRSVPPAQGKPRRSQRHLDASALDEPHQYSKRGVTIALYTAVQSTTFRIIAKP